MRGPIAAITLAAAVSLAAAGCGAGTTSTTTSAKTATATTGGASTKPGGDAITTADATFSTPAGWKQAGSDVKDRVNGAAGSSGLEPLAVLVPEGTGKGKLTSVIVIAKKAVPGAGKEAAKDFATFKSTVKSGFDSAAKAGGGESSGATLGPDTDVDGTKAMSVSFRQKAGTVTLGQHQIIVAKGDAAYYLQATIAKSAKDQKGPIAAVESIRSSWHWK